MTAPTIAPAGGPPAGGGRFTALIKKKPLLVTGGIGAAAVVGFALYRQHENAAASSAAAGLTSAATTTTGTSIPSAYTDDSGDYDSLEQQIANLQSTVSSIPPATAGATGAAGPAGPAGTAGTGAALKAFSANGTQTLAQIAAKYGVSPQTIITDTQNSEKMGPAWLAYIKAGVFTKPLPKNATVYYPVK